MRRWALLPLLICLPLLLGQAAPDWRQDWDSIRRAAGQIEGLQAEFVQEKHLAILKAPLRSTGRFLFRKPLSLRWEYTEPLASVLLMADTGVKRFIRRDGAWLPDASEGLQAMQMVLEEIRLCLAGRYQDSQNFRAELKLTPRPRVILKPRSRELAKVISAIELHLAQAPGQLARVVIVESPKARTELIFSRVRLNPKLDDALFRNP